MLAKRLSAEGYTPIVNLSYPNQQHCIDGMNEIYAPLTHIIDFVNNIGGFIGIRSGLCDLLISSDNPKKYSVYPIEHIDWCNDLAKWYYLVHFKFATLDQHIDDIVNSLNGRSVSELENHKSYGINIIPDYSPSND